MRVLQSVSPTVSIEVEGDTQAAIFEELGGNHQEVFGHKECGVCKGTELRFICRTNEAEDKFYEMSCCNWKCRAKLPFGCYKKPKGGLYPKRRWESLSPGEKVSRAYQEKDCNDKGYLPDNGWYVFKKTDAPRKEESHDAPPAKAPF